MADSKVSDLTAATSIGGSDLFYVVQSNLSKNVTAATVFANASNVTLKGTIGIDTSVQQLSSPGIVDLSKPITQLSADATGGTIVITRPEINQFKYIVMTSTAGGSYTISGGNVAGSQTITFSNVGDTATLLYVNNKWFMVGGTATIV